MTFLHKLNSLIDDLAKCESSKRIAMGQDCIVAFVDKCPLKQFKQCMNLLMQRLSDDNFTHVFRNLLSDSEFLQKYHNQLLDFLISKLSDNNVNRIMQQSSGKKKYVILEYVLNNRNKQQSGDSLGSKLIETRCRRDVGFCYYFLHLVNQCLNQFSEQQIQKLDLNGVIMLAIRVVKGWNVSKNNMSVQLIDQALRLINSILMEKLASQQQQANLQNKQIVTLILKKVITIIQSKTHKIGNSYKFIGLYIQNYNNKSKQQYQLSHEQLLTIIQLTTQQVSTIFPNLQHLPMNCLQNQIQKQQQYYQMNIINQQLNHNNGNNQIIIKQQQKHQQLSNRNFNNQLFTQYNLRISLLKGVSSFICQLFLHLAQNSSQYQQIINNITQHNSRLLNVFIRVFQLLSYCNNHQIFTNFIKIYHHQSFIQQTLHIHINISQQHLIKQIIRNCPNPIQQNYYQNINNMTEISSEIQQQQKIITYLQQIIQKQIIDGKINQILQQIKQKIQKQYDQKFNQRQFQSACNTLILVIKSALNIQYKSSQQNHSILSKDEIIEWIKALLNLNQSCLPVNRKIIVSKTYQIISQVYDIILPGNQYLQEVIETQIIVRSYPKKKSSLQKLIQFYQKHGDSIFQQGYKNKIELKKFTQTFHSLLYSHEGQPIETQEKQQKSKQTKLQTQISNANFRKYKLLDRIYKKLQSNQLTLKDRVYLWKIIVRIYKLNLEKNELINVKDISKMFSSRPEILIAKHLLSQTVEDKEIKSILTFSKQQLQTLGNQFKEYPFFYEDQLQAFNQLK